MRTLYKTEDGKEFNNKKEAMKYEKELKNKPKCICQPWLDPDTFTLYSRMPGSHIGNKCPAARI